MSAEFWEELREKHKDSSDETKAAIEAAAKEAETPKAPERIYKPVMTFTPPSKRNAPEAVAVPAVPEKVTTQNIVTRRYTKPSQRKIA